MKFYKSIALIGLAILICIAGAKTYNRLTDGFSIRKITSNLSYDSQWDSLLVLKEDEEKIRSILTQNFHYLGKGCQSYVFASDDQRYVLKFFKFQHLDASSFWDFLPLPHPFIDYLEDSKRRRKEKLQRLFTGCKLAYEIAPKETGVVYIHLNKTNSLGTQTTIYNKMGIAYLLDLDEYEFILQKKAIPAKDLIQNSNPKEVVELFVQLIKVLIARNKKGVIDLDPATIQNIGFTNNSAMILDVGQLAKIGTTSPSIASNEIPNRMNEIRKWVSRYHPELQQTLEERIHAHLLE